MTNKTDDPRPNQVQGIQKQVLQPGIYFLNPEEKRIDIVSIGYSETTLMVEAERRLPVQRRPARRPPGQDARRATRSTSPGKGIEFPSNDGFLIHLDFTAIWGITPEQAPDVVRQFGTLKDVEQKVILPQIGSICRLHGSKRGAVDLLVGDTREAFQTETSEELEQVLASKNLTLLFGLTRHIYVRAQVREPIQKAKIADELTKTREQEQLTAKAQADLTEAKAKVTLEEKRTCASTDKLVAELEAEGEKKAREIEATTEKLMAEIDAKTATIDGPVDHGPGRGDRQHGRARSAKPRPTASASTSRPSAAPTPTTATSSPKDSPPNLRLGVFYAGPGTFWTDLKGIEQTLLGKLASDTAQVQDSTRRAPAVSAVSASNR